MIHLLYKLKKYIYLIFQSILIISNKGYEVNGFYAVFNKVIPIINKFTKKECNLTIRIEFDCNKNEAWPLPNDGTNIGKPPAPTSYKSYTNESCEVLMSNFKI